MNLRTSKSKLTKKMMGLAWIVIALALLVELSAAFTVSPPGTVRCESRLFAGMAQPDVKIKTTTKQITKSKEAVKQKNKVETGDPVNRRDEDFEDAPMFKLMLIADDGYEIEHVITRLTSILEDMDEDQAATVFEQAQISGKAMCGKYPFERAELFKEQLIRSEPMIFSDLEEENK